MNIWDGDSFEQRMLVKPDDVELFLSEIKTSGIGALEEAFSLSYTCLSDDDIMLVKKSFVPDIEVKGTNLCYIDELNDLFKRRDFSSAYNYLKVHKKISHVEGIVCSSLKELSYLMSLSNRFFNHGPIEMDTIWIESDLIFTKQICDIISKAKVKKCPILSFLEENKKRLKELNLRYVSSKPEIKLRILSACFLLASEIERENENISFSVVYLHRAIETIFIAWLIECRELSLTCEGTIDKDSYLYLLDYMELVKKERVVSEVEELSLRKLNKLRNTSKLAHGYSEPMLDDFDVIILQIKKIIISDEDASSSYNDILRVLTLPQSIYKLILSFLFDKAYIKKLAL